MSYKRTTHSIGMSKWWSGRCWQCGRMDWVERPVMLTTAKVETVQSFVLNTGPDKSSTIQGQTELYCQMRPCILKSERGARWDIYQMCNIAHWTMMTQDCIVTSYIHQGPSVPTAHDGIAIVACFCISGLLCIVIVTWYCRPESMVICFGIDLHCMTGKLPCSWSNHNDHLK